MSSNTNKAILCIITVYIDYQNYYELFDRSNIKNRLLLSHGDRLFDYFLFVNLACWSQNLLSLSFVESIPILSNILYRVSNAAKHYVKDRKTLKRKRYYRNVKNIKRILQNAQNYLRNSDVVRNCLQNLHQK